MDGQMNIFDFPEFLPDDLKSDFPCDGCVHDQNNSCSYNSKNDYCVMGDKRIAFDDFQAHCKHRGWLKRDEETETAYWMCDYSNKQPAKCWDDWIKCEAGNCPLLKED